MQTPSEIVQLLKKYGWTHHENRPVQGSAVQVMMRGPRFASPVTLRFAIIDVLEEETAELLQKERSATKG